MKQSPVERDDTSTVNIPGKYEGVTIVRAENPQTETIAWLASDGNKISVDFPERNDAFQEITRSFGLRWDGKTVSRTLDNFAGSVSDRLAELGYNFLLHDFNVVFPTEAIQKMAISGTYDTECKRWVIAMVNGKYSGWFVLRWIYPENCYDIARSVSGSRYCKPSVVVPPEQFAEVIDFAQTHKFRFSEGALTLVTKAKSIFDNALVVSIKQRENDDYPLNTPELDWGDYDLADDLEFDGPSDTTS